MYKKEDEEIPELDDIKQVRENPKVWVHIMTNFVGKIVTGWSKRSPDVSRLSNYCPETLEAFLFLCLENYYQTWKTEVSKRRGDDPPILDEGALWTKVCWYACNW